VLLPSFVTWIYGEQRSFYDNSSSSSFFFVLIVPLKEKVKFISFSFYSLSDSNIIIMNNESKHSYHPILCTPTFHVDCIYLTRWKSSAHSLFSSEEKNFLFYRKRKCSFSFLSKFNICIRWTHETILEMTEWPVVCTRKRLVHSFVCMFSDWSLSIHIYIEYE
jgi:hypothetical protein